MSERLVIRASTPDEAGVVFDLVRELAVYEKLDTPQFFPLTPEDVAGGCMEAALPARFDDCDSNGRGILAMLEVINR